MRTILSSIITIDDLKKYFTGGPIWKHSEVHNGKMTGNCKRFSYEIEPIEVIFAYHVESVYDPIDSEEGESSEPLKKITEFLGRGIPGGEFFNKMAFRPDDVSSLLLKVATIIPIRNKKKEVIAILKKLNAVISHETSRFDVVDIDDAFSELKKKMETKKWNFNEIIDYRGISIFEFKIGDEFKGEISVDSILYSYTFNLKGYPDLIDTGITKDPIITFEKYHKSKDVKDAEKEIESLEEEVVEEADNSDYNYNDDSDFESLKSLFNNIK